MPHAVRDNMKPLLGGSAAYERLCVSQAEDSTRSTILYSAKHNLQHIEYEKEIQASTCKMVQELLP